MLTPFFQEEILFEENITEWIYGFELPNENLLIGYIDLSSRLLKFKFKTASTSEWEDLTDPQFENAEQLSLPIQFQNMILFFDNKGNLMLIFNPNMLNEEDLSSLFTAESYSYGKSWGNIHPLYEEEFQWAVFSRPIIVRNGLYSGRIILPVVQSAQRSMFLLTNDNMRSWQFSLYLEPTEEAESLDDETLGCTINPAIIENLDSSLQAYFHITNWPGLYSSNSQVYGEIWNEAELVQNVEIESALPYRVIRINNKDETLSSIVIIAGWQQQTSGVLSFMLYISNPEGLFNTPFITIGDIGDQIADPTRYGCDLFQDKEANLHLLYQNDKCRIQHLVYTRDQLEEFQNALRNSIF